MFDSNMQKPVLQSTRITYFAVLLDACSGMILQVTENIAFS